jgi:hypothetical protein
LLKEWCLCDSKHSKPQCSVPHTNWKLCGYIPWEYSAPHCKGLSISGDSGGCSPQAASGTNPHAVPNWVTEWCGDGCHGSGWRLQQGYKVTDRTECAWFDLLWKLTTTNVLLRFIYNLLWNSFYVWLAIDIINNATTLTGKYLGKKSVLVSRMHPENLDIGYLNTDFTDFLFYLRKWYNVYQFPSCYYELVVKPSLLKFIYIKHPFLKTKKKHIFPNCSSSLIDKIKTPWPLSPAVLKSSVSLCC